MDHHKYNYHEKTILRHSNYLRVYLSTLQPFHPKTKPKHFFGKINQEIQLLMNSFKDFIRGNINYYVLHFKKNRVLLELNGEPRQEINFSFDHLSDLYLAYSEEQNSNQINNEMSLGQLDVSAIKITDNDFIEFWEHLDPAYHQSFNIEGQDIGDETILKISELYSEGRCTFPKLVLSGNIRISAVSIHKLGLSLQSFPAIKELYLHGLQIGEFGINRIIELIGVTSLTNIDLGYIGNESLKYLSTILEKQHNIEELSFGQNLKDKWQTDGKSQFQKCVRRSESCKGILALNLYPEQLINHYDMISEFNIICKKNRALKLQSRENQFKAASLNPAHNKYYESDNHNLNAYKFSVKSYLNNVFGSLLDEALYFLQKERRNSLRQQAIFNITKQPINKIILEDICTADGSIIVLTKYLLKKIKEKEAQQ